MDKLIHQIIVVETLKALNLEPSEYGLLLDATIEPDKEYEQNIERRIISEKGETKDIEKRYENKRGKNVLESIGIELSKRWDFFSSWLKSVTFQVLEYSSWALEHGSKAKDNAISCFDRAETSHGLERLINLGHCLHFVADLGTPYHGKKLEEVGKISSDVPKELNNQTFLKNLVEFSKSVFVDHQIFEKELASFWFTDLGKNECKRYLRLGFNSAKKRPFTSIEEARLQFLAAIEEIEKVSSKHCKILDIRFITRRAGEKLSQEDREIILKAGLDCLAKIAEASYIALKAILAG